MALPSLKTRSDQALHREVKELRSTENQSISEIVLRLAEIDSRGTFRDAGYSSLFVYCTEELGYSESSAYRRIEAARALKHSPEIYDLLRDGKITLGAIGTVAKALTAENKGEVLALTQGKSKVEVERIAARFGGFEQPKRERVRVKRVVVPVKAEGGLFDHSAKEEPRVEERFSVSFELTAEEMALFQEARSMVGSCEMKEVLKRTVKEFIERRRPKAPGKQNSVAKVTSVVKVQSRYIAAEVRREVRERDGGQCTYVSPDGKRCRERHRLQFDHVQPFALGGENSVENLRLVCAAHNQLFAERAFGREKILKFTKRAPA